MHVPLIVLLLEGLHVLSNVSTEDVLLEDLGIKLLALGIVSREALLIVGDEDTTVRSTLHSTKDTRSSRRATKTDIEVAFERTGSILLIRTIVPLVSRLALRPSGSLLGRG